MAGRIRSALGRIKKTLERIFLGSREFLSGELDKVKKFSKLLARGVVALFVMAIVAGIALSSLIKSFAFDLLMPLIGLISPRGDWRNLQIRVGQTRFSIGNFLAHLVFFLLVAAIVLLVVRLMPKRPGFGLREVLKNCPSCGEILPRDAKECSSCGATFLDLPEPK